MKEYTKHLHLLFKNYKLGFLLGVVLSLALMVLAFIEDSLLKVVIYLLTLFGGFLLSEFFYHKKKIKNLEWEVIHPKNEFYVIAFTQIVVVSLTIFWFLVVDHSTVNFVVKIITLVLRLLFVFPIFLLVYFLAIKKYTLKQLGILGFDHWYVSLPIILLIGGVSYLFFPDGLQFKAILKENGYHSLITLGFLTAAIPEEITRSLFQSRLGIMLNNKIIAWFAASVLWAVIHIPLFTFNTNGNYYDAIISALGILPIGLLWGYLNERYKSIIPSVLIHGTNLWGLHNIF